MKIIDIIPVTKIPLAQPQILSYFSISGLPTGALVEIPLGRRKEIGVVFDSHKAADLKMEIKKAGYELRPIAKIISGQPILTGQQIKLALWLGQYYFCSPGIFLKMMMPKKITKPKLQNPNYKFPKPKLQKLFLIPTMTAAQKSAKGHGDTIVWHSNLPKKQLEENWWRIKNGQAPTIVGTRSAVFLPFQNLKEIIIEEKTNPAHRSWDMFPHYRVHEVAQKLSEIFGAKLILKSEIPSVDSYYLNPQLKINSYKQKTDIIDMRSEIKSSNFSIFSRALQEIIKKALEQKKQIIIFINRRGTANFVLCRDCGYIVKCKNCDAPLAHHLINGQPMLLCHRCGYKETPPDLCPKCQSYRIKTVGVGTQKVELEAKKLFPQAKISRLDSDAAPTPEAQQKIIEGFIKKEIDILVATQIIFSWLDEIKSTSGAAVAIISADTLLHLPDFHSGERTFQTISLLKNLSRLNEKFIIQTYNPENPVINFAAKDDWQSFYQEEIEARKLLNYPPFSQIVKLTSRHQDPKKIGQEAKILAAKLKHANKNNQIEISDALPAFIPKEKSKYIWNIIIKFPIINEQLPTSSEFLLRRNSLLQYVPSNWNIDVDPESLL